MTMWWWESGYRVRGKVMVSQARDIAYLQANVNELQRKVHKLIAMVERKNKHINLWEDKWNYFREGRETFIGHLEEFVGVLKGTEGR